MDIFSILYSRWVGKFYKIIFVIKQVSRILWKENKSLKEDHYKRFLILKFNKKWFYLNKKYLTTEDLLYVTIGETLYYFW